MILFTYIKTEIYFYQSFKKMNVPRNNLIKIEIREKNTRTRLSTEWYIFLRLKRKLVYLIIFICIKLCIYFILYYLLHSLYCFCMPYMFNPTYFRSVHLKLERQVYEVPLLRGRVRYYSRLLWRILRPFLYLQGILGGCWEAYTAWWWPWEKGRWVYCLWEPKKLPGVIEVFYLLLYL